MTTQINSQFAEGAERRLFYPHVEAELSRPWAMEPLAFAELRRTAAHVLGRRAAGDPLSAEEIEERIKAGPGSGSVQQQGQVAVLPLYGVLMPRATLMSQLSGGTSLDQFQAMLTGAVNDPTVSAIVLDVNSPGGSVALTPETAAVVRAAASKKPIVAVCNTMCASGAYWLASQCTELVASPSALVGSIGVYQEHFDLSQMLESMGVNPTIVKAGKYKAEGNEYEPLGADALAAMQDMVDEFYGMFTADVAKGRNVPARDVRGGFGEGRVVTAKQALVAGMVDRIDTLQGTIAKVAKGQIGSPRATAAGELLAHASTSFATGEMLATAVKPHSTEVVDEPWDGPAEEAKLDEPITAARGTGMYAWYDADGDDPDGDGYPDAKTDWKFPHHMVSAGDPGPANVNGVRNGLARLEQANIPASDREGVRAHLQRHLDDFNKAKSLASPDQLAAESGEDTATAVDPAFARYF